MDFHNLQKLSGALPDLSSLLKLTYLDITNTEVSSSCDVAIPPQLPPEMAKMGTCCNVVIPKLDVATTMIVDGVYNTCDRLTCGECSEGACSIWACHGVSLY